MEKEFINPPELHKHPAYSRVITVKGPCKFIFIAGQTPSDENYKPVHPGDYRKQYEHIIKMLTIQLTAAGATWDDVVVRRVFTLDVDALQKAMREPGVKRPENANLPPTSTMIGVTRLSNPGFLIEIDLIAITNA
ncbi:MAG TPA: RidA family protein [Stellaceae bacterium]|jgi:enamine deaminase RidA (YjgF/YER057c/UK114 family)